MDGAMAKAAAAFDASVLSDFGAEVNRVVKTGQSPVKLWGRQREYSESYKAAIKSGRGIRGTDGSISRSKRVRPVNLTVSGAMLASQKTSKTRDGVRIEYRSPVAAWHNRGTLRMPARPILPTDDGDVFNRSLTRFLYDLAKKAVYKALRRGA
jgi:hypothetical protein